MIAVYVGSARLEFDEPEVRIGSDPACGIAVPFAEPHHCTLLPKAAGCFVVPRAETVVNDKVIDAPRALYREDKLVVGRHMFFVEHLDERDPIETRFLLEIRRGDLAAREVYADWLDENGDPRRADLLRLEDRCAALPKILRGRYEVDEAREALLRERRRLAVAIDLDWRVRITRVPVERCDAVDCDMDWSKLDETNDLLRRHCRECNQHVHYKEERPGRTNYRVCVDATIRRDFDEEDTFGSGW